MTTTTFQLEKLIGQSADGIEAAVDEALKSSTAMRGGQTWMSIEDIRANITADGKIGTWQVMVEISSRSE